jgi:hypothetical protein
MNQLNELLNSANPYKTLQSDAARLARKWQKTGLLEGLDSENHINSMAMMLENQAKQLVVESSNTGGGSGAATFTTGTGAQWAGIALPMVRKIFGQISSKEFVSVQPMNLPSGLVFYLDFQYGSTKKPFTSGDSMFGNTGDAGPFGNIAEGGLYGAGKFGFTINNITASVASASVAVSTPNFYTDLYANSTYVASGSYYKLSIPTSSFDSAFDKKAVRSFYLGAAGDPTIAQQLPGFTKLSGGNIDFIVSSTGSAGATTGTTNSVIYYSLQPLDKNRGDFEDGNTNLNANNDPIAIPEIKVDMKSEGIIAKTRKLKAVWTPEFAQDLNAYQSLDAEAELTGVMSEYISLEIDLEILDMLISSAAAGTEYWSAQNNLSISSAGVVNSNLGFYNTQGGWFQTLGTKIQKLSNVIHQKTLRGAANFIICSPTVGTIMESIPGYASSSDGDASKANYAFGIQKAGQLNGRYQVWKNPYMNENIILLGFRGSQYLEAGAVFAPYIPLIMTPLVYDPDTFTPRKGLLTRYAKKVLRPEFFGKIYVSGLNTL